MKPRHGAGVNGQYENLVSSGPNNANARSYSEFLKQAEAESSKTKAAH